MFGHGYFSGETAFGLRGSNPHGRKPCRVRLFPDPTFCTTVVARTLLSAQAWPVVKTTVTSPETRVMQVRILPRSYVRVVEMGRRLMFRCRMFPGLNKLCGSTFLSEQDPANAD